MSKSHILHLCGVKEGINNPKLVPGDIIVVTEVNEPYGAYSKGELYIVSVSVTAPPNCESSLRITSLTDGKIYSPVGILDNEVGVRVLGPSDRLEITF